MGHEKELLFNTVLKPTQVIRYKCTKVNRITRLKELGKMTP